MSGCCDVLVQREATKRFEPAGEIVGCHEVGEAHLNDFRYSLWGYDPGGRCPEKGRLLDMMTMWKAADGACAAAPRSYASTNARKSALMTSAFTEHAVAVAWVSFERTVLQQLDREQGAVADRHDLVVVAVQHECRHADRRWPCFRVSVFPRFRRR
jgi:hypothetical protein